MKFLTELKNDFAAVAILSDWLGEGMRPVESELSESRATICASCPMNQKGNWWADLKNALAGRIREQIALKNRLNVRTSLDDLLGTCKTCTCPMPLKVHTPIKHIMKHTPPEHLKAFDPKCWILSENGAK